MKRELLSFGVLLVLVTASGQVVAQYDGATRRGYTPSPKRYAFEIKLGPYAPNIDSEFENGATPFKDLFGDGIGIIVLAEFDFQLFNKFGSLGIGLQGGYYANSAKPFLDDDGDPTTPATTNERVAGETSITIAPISVLAVYRFDVLANRFDIPLVPYAKLGLNYTMWWIRRGDGSVANYEGQSGSGGSWGWQFNIGLAIQLDVLDRDASRNLDQDYGVNHSYIFAELLHLDADGFGNSSKLQVGDTTFVAGLALEF
jgi:hypothetical protein